MLLPNVVRRGAIISLTKNQFGFAHGKGSYIAVMKWMAQSRYNALNLNEILNQHKDFTLAQWTIYETKVLNEIHISLIDHQDENKKFFARIDDGQEMKIGFFSSRELNQYLPIKYKEVEDWFD